MKENKHLFINKIIFSETFLYLVVGGLTTIINWAVFVVVNELLKQNNLKMWFLAEAAAFISAVLFAFFCDKFIVFKHPFVSIKKLLAELISFVSARLIINTIAVIVMAILIETFSINEYIAKLVSSIINIVLNYLVSKFLIFNKRNEIEKL